MTLKDLAELIFFGMITNKKDLEKRIEGHWFYRKNKSFEDVNKVIKKGIKVGRGKTEMEIDYAELYLKDVFKKDRSIKN